ncbi:Hypothetical predicted protein [Cloeon dipterum]|uniref:Uncharacterized protein n=1 Tax=Cloeon dipterum TaxID=197152 RepID=A0A8S1D3Y9_9INSE|nr:Hypothetical predicted protein [Cloeon dipterum]
MCRLCGTDTLNVVRHHIFEGEGQVKKSAQKISECLPLHIAAEDPLPKNICGECSYKLDLMSDFREKAVKTDVMLVSLVEGVKPEIPDDDDDGPDHEIDNDFRSDSPVEQPEQQTEPEVLIKEEEAQQPQQPEKRPGRKAANKRPIQESDMEEEEEEAPAKKRGRKPKEKETAPAASATTSASTNPPKENTGGPLFECSHCHHMTATLGQMRVHVANRHLPRADIPPLNGRRAQCVECERTFGSAKKLADHLARHTGARPFECGLCDRGFSTQGRLDAHMTLHTSVWTHECTECGAAFATKADLTAHERRHTGATPFSCLLCAAAFASRDLLADHNATCHPDESLFTCQHCGKRFGVAAKFREHLRTHAERRHACVYCDAKFATPSRLNAHIQTHTRGERHFLCDACGKRFPSAKDLTLHETMSHSEEKRFICEHCARPFARREGLVVHLRTHTGERPFECAECGHAFTQRHALQTHERTHTGERPFRPLPVFVRPVPGPQPVIGGIAFQCRHCSELFKTHYDVAIHIKEAHKYKCTTCRYRGSTEADLEKHMENHPAQVEKENLPRCCICLRSCISREAYEHHLKLHIGSLPFECENCDLLFPDKQRLENHMKRHVDFPRKQGGVYVRKALKPRVAHQKKTVQYKGHECSICQQRFLRRDDMRNHKRRYHARAKVIASSERVVRNSNLAKKKLNASRLLTAKRLRKFDCPCGETFTQLEVLLRHRAESHPDWTHACQRCERIYKTPLQLASHIDRAHPGSAYECSECKEKLKTMVGMLNHKEKRCPLRKVQVNAPTSLGKLSCDICAKEFESKAEIEVHVMLHLHKIKNIMKEISKIEATSTLLASTPPKPAAQNQGKKKKSNFVQCPSCDMNVPEFQWKMHQVLHDNPNRPKCAKCNFVTVTQGKMLAHTNSHLDTEAPFSCSVCHLNFREKYWAEKHTSAYHGNKARVKNNFEVAAKQQNKLAKVKACPMCTESFNDPLSYQTHLLAHKQVQSFQKCKHCDTRIRGFDMMVTHLKLQHCLHVTVPLNCPMCNLLLNNRFSLSRHVTSMHPSCPYCKQMQSSKAALVSHISLRHPDMLPSSPPLDGTTVKVEPPETSPSAEEATDAEPPSRNTIDALKNFVATKGNIASNSVGNGVEPNSAAASQQLPALVPISDQKQTKARRPPKPKIAKQALPPESNVAETHNMVKIESAQYEGYDLNGVQYLLKSHSRNRNTCHLCPKRPTMYSCKYCHVLFATRSEVHVHIAESHPKTHGCVICACQFRTAQLAAEHTLVHRDRPRRVKRVTCEHCLSTLSSAQALALHIQRRHEPRPGTESKLFVCSSCGKTFGRRYQLLEHERRHSGERPFQCVQCGSSFASSSNLASHMTKHRPPSLACPECDKRFGSTSTLRAHRQSHLPVEARRAFQCEVCGRSLLSAAHLRQHRLGHDESAPSFECAECGKRFRHLRSLREHVQLHSGAKGHVCELCGKAYAMRHSLTTHRRTHDAPFRCQVCGQIFAHYSSLLTHTRTHNNIPVSFVPKQT